MEKDQNPGIQLNNINLVDCCLSGLNLENDLQFNLGIESFQRQKLDDKHLAVRIAFDLMQEIENPPYKLTCSFVAFYERTDESPMTWKEFEDAMVIAHILPYVREFVSGVTLRLPLPPLMLPPTNAFALHKRYKERELKKEI